MNSSSWIDSHRHFFLTVKDVKSFKNGERYELLFLDRNWQDVNDHETDERYQGVSFRPEVYFKQNKHKYIHDKDNQGTALWSWGSEEFEFEIEWKRDHWYPLVNGILRGHEQDPNFTFENQKGKHYTEFSDNTLLGWRGPIMLWEKLKNLSDICPDDV